MKIRLLISLLALTVWSFNGLAQVAINDTGDDPDPSAMLDVNSTTRGLLVPRMSNQDRDNIANPAPGLIIYSKDDNMLYYYNASRWVSFGGDNDWVIDGNNMFSGVAGNVGIGLEQPNYNLDIFEYSFNVGNAKNDIDGDGFPDPDGGRIRTDYRSGSAILMLEEHDDPFLIKARQTDNQDLRDLTLGLFDGHLGINLKRPQYDLDIFRFSLNVGHNSGDANGDGFQDSEGGKLYTYFDNDIPYLVFEDYDDPVIIIGRQTQYQDNRDLILSMYRGNLGVGIEQPTVKLDVDGVMRLRASQAPASPQSGEIYYDGSHFYGYTGGAWKQLDN